MQVSALTAIFKADFGRFRPVPAILRPYRPPADMTRYGRYGPILAESARFGANRAASARIEPSRRESDKKKKKKKTQTRSDARATASDAGATPLVPRSCFLDHDETLSNGMYHNDKGREFLFLFL